MATHRPGFARANTSDIALTTFSPAAGSSSSANPQPYDRSTDKTSSKQATVQVDETPDESEVPPTSESAEDERLYREEHLVLSDAKDLTTTIIHVEDDVNSNPWTFRMFFLGIGLSIFGSVLQEIFYFKLIFVSVVFITVLAYVFGEGMALIIPRKSLVGRFLNPGPFSSKEHAAITLMASAASQSALATQALAAQQLFYGGYPSHAAGIFITLSSQLIGYGLAGMLREVLVWPTRMLWPMNLPITSLLESLHRNKRETRKKLKTFSYFYVGTIVWEWFPEYIFPLLEGISVFCLAKQDSLVFTNIFGGAQANEGLGFLSWCMDWQYIASYGSPLWFPLQTLFNQFLGWLICIVLYIGLYYNNTWRAQDFPFLSQLLFESSSNATTYVPYDQSTILTSTFEIDQAAVKTHGTPWMAATYVAYLITTNAGLTATIVHMFLWNYEDIKAGWSWATRENFQKVFRASFWKFWGKQPTPQELYEKRKADPDIDPHYKLMLKNGYVEAPTWWYGAVFVSSFVVAIICLHVMGSTLPIWGFIVAMLFLLLCMLLFGAQYGITGFQFNIQPVSQLFAGYLFPGKPLANMYFTCFTFNALQMGQVLAKDLKLAQYVHLSPRNTFTIQILGAAVGAMFNYLMMLTIVENQAPILTSIEGTNIWSGQNVQLVNTLAISSSMPDVLFSVGARYQWVTLSFLVGFLVPLPFYFAYKYTGRPIFKYLNMSIILWYAGYLVVGINSSVNNYFLVGFVAQWWLRKYRPALFNKYNYLVSAALDGGTQVLVFVLTFAVFGGSGKAVPFPTWAGNPDTTLRNLDYCMLNPANGE